jgi:hypothetical protein
MTKHRKFKTFVRQTKMGRPITVAAERAIGIRLSSRQLDAVDAWAKTNALSRSEAIRRLIERGLGAEVADGKPRRKRRQKNQLPSLLT